MNDLLKQRIARLLDTLSDERGYEILDTSNFSTASTRSGRVRGEFSRA